MQFDTHTDTDPDTVTDELMAATGDIRCHCRLADWQAGRQAGTRAKKP